MGVQHVILQGLYLFTLFSVLCALPLVHDFLPARGRIINMALDKCPKVVVKHSIQSNPHPLIDGPCTQWWPRMRSVQ